MRRKLFKSGWISGLIFTVTFICLFWVFDYSVTFFQPPQSVHTWRQTNSLSMTQMYYQYKVPFFQPEIHNQMCDDGMSGITVGEFPVIYYTVAQLWKIFGKSEWIFRFVQLLILFAGVFLLFRMLTPMTGNPVKAGFISMLVTTSPMIIFYGPNFLPDAPALAFTFIGWFFLYKFTRNRNSLSLWSSAFFVFLAVSLKITTATSFIAIGGWIIMENMFLKEPKRTFNFKFIHYIPFIISFILILAWYKYVDYFTTLHTGAISYFGIWPVWKMTAVQFHQVVDAMDKIYLNEFFWLPLQYASILVWVFMLFKIRKVPPLCGFLLIAMPLGFLAILLLWFQVLEGHDYYLISQVQVMVIVWAVFFSYLKDKKYFNHPVTLLVLVALFAVLANHGRARHKMRYEGWMNEGFKLHMEALTTIEPFFQKWNIQTEDKVISLPDFSINASLYYMNRKGYTEFGSDFNLEETYIKRIQQGAKFLIINDTTILEKPLVRKYADYYIGKYLNVKVFDLRPYNDLSSGNK